MSGFVEPGCRVTLHYTLELGDGTRVESTRDSEPATVTIGSGDLLALLEEKLLGMEVGERRHISLSATETRDLASGDSSQTLSRADFPADMEIRPGQVIGFTLPDGQEIPGLVLEATADSVQVDFDHPLAGRDLRFDVEILAIESM